jgi:hypothetical protein
MKFTRLFSVLGVVTAMGCGTGEKAGEKEPTKKSEAALLTSSGGNGLLTAPDCLNPQIQRRAVAQPHSQNPTPPALTQYTSSFPPSLPLLPDGGTNPEAVYESQVWGDISHSNGYMYLVRLDHKDNNQQADLVFLVGIRDRLASPPYLMSPPAAPGRTPVPPAPFAATNADYTEEYNLSTSNPSPPVAASLIACVTVVDQNGNPIDYFPVADTHDPSCGPW